RAVERFTPLLELTEPGTVTFGALGPSRYHGGDEALARQVVTSVTAVLGDQVRATGLPGVGVADGRFAATLAARRAARAAVAAASGAHIEPASSSAASAPPSSSTLGRAPTGAEPLAPVTSEGSWLVVPPGGSAAFLAPLSVTNLPDQPLVDLLDRLGIRTLGQLATLPAADVLGRFGPLGQEAHRAAIGLDDRPPG